MSVLFDLDTRTHEQVCVSTFYDVAAVAAGDSLSSSIPATDDVDVCIASSYCLTFTDDCSGNGDASYSSSHLTSGNNHQTADHSIASAMFSPASQTCISSSGMTPFHVFAADTPSPCTVTTSDNSDSNSSTTFDFTQLGLSDDTKPLAVGAAGGPHLIIQEQPVDKFRFRYKSEMHGTHGSLTGAGSGKKKTFPAVELHGYAGVAYIYCSLHQTAPFRERLHSHSLVVRRDNADCRDPHDVTVGPEHGFRAEFPGMGIIHTAKKYIVDELHEKLMERHQMVHDRDRELTELEHERLRLRAKDESSQMNLNQVCLCFEAFRLVPQPDGGQRFEPLCEPVYSRSINNMKSALTGELKITRLSTTCCDAAGNTDLFLFVEKVGKKNIQVRFYELDDKENVVWEDFGQFAESDVHHQYAIALRTPAYRNRDIEHKVHVFVQLYRKSDHCYSAPLSFQYKPRSSTQMRKRARMSSAFNSTELPTVLADAVHDVGGCNGGATGPFLMNTISTEFNKSDLINQLMAKSSEDSLYRYVLDNPNAFDGLMDDDSMDALQTDYGRIAMTVSDGDGGGGGDGSRLEKRVTLLRQQIDRVARSQSRQKAHDYLESMWIHAKVDILQMALADECGDRAAHLVIDLLADYDLAEVLNYSRDTDNHYYALHTACLYNRHECIGRMLRLGAHPNVTDRTDNTPLHLAVKESFTDCVRVICDAANYPTAVAAAGPVAATSLPQLHIDATNDKGYTALHLAIRARHLDMVQILTAAGASAAKRDTCQGNNSLHMAVQYNSTDIVQHLMATTAVDVLERNTSNLTALELAAINEKTTDVTILELLQRDDQHAAVRMAVAPPKRPTTTTTAMNIDAGLESISLSGPSSSSSSTSSGSSVSGCSAVTAQPTKVVEPLFDAICLHQLCALFNSNGGWKQLAETLKLSEFVGVWQFESDPTLAMFRFAERHGYKLPYMVNMFVDMDNREALGCLDEMIARRMERE